MSTIIVESLRNIMIINGTFTVQIAVGYNNDVK